MKNKTFAQCIGSSLAVITLAVVSPARADLVYDNSTGDLNIRLNPGANEIGDEIILDGTARTISDFRFQYWGEAFSGSDEEARLRFYLNDGPAAPAGPLTPGTIFFDSDWFSVIQTERLTVVFNDFVTGAAVPLIGALPDTFTWTVVFRGVDAGESAGVDLYDPPGTGGNYLEYWENTGGGWEYRGVDGTAMNFGARLNAVPEPGILALGLVGGLLALVIRNRFKQS